MSDNPQFIRTDKAIIQALISLLKKKPFEKITVQDILDETPVTRATFYAHYRDKYEIAEKMMAHFIETRESVRRILAAPDHPSVDQLRKLHTADVDAAKALLKIHTENVDLREALAAKLEREYLERTNSETRQIEARIYAQSHVELYLSMITEQNPGLSVEQTYRIFIPVVISLLHLTDDQEIRGYLEDKITKRLANSKK